MRLPYLIIFPFLFSILFLASRVFTEDMVIPIDLSEVSPKVTIPEIQPPYDRLKPLHIEKLPPGPHDWLLHHYESGQTFAEFVQSQPPKPEKKRQRIDVVLLGDFDAVRRKVIQQTVKYMEAFFALPVRITLTIPLSEIPPKARRVHPLTQDHQILTTYVLEEILIPRRKEGAFATIAFTSSDLWPGEGWNFVFGQASPTDQVGVWSIYRNGDPQEGEEALRLCLLRTIKTGTHEVAHMFGLAHCIYYECAMNGSNHRLESDRRPLWLCPVCLNKLTWVLSVDPRKRFRKLIEVNRKFGFEREAGFFEQSLKVLEESPRDNPKK